MASAAASTIASITLTSGIQDISALLPLLGTEQCERHIGSALTEGYLYAAATPLSIFGSLGMATAGFKTCLACFSIPAWNIAGAQKLRDAGFEAKGINFVLITVDKDHRYITETRLTSLLHDLHIEEVHKLTVQTYSLLWNVKMLCLTAFLCTLNVLPYIHLNVRGDSFFHPQVRWAFPIIRALGGFFTATTLQVIIQIRLSILIKKQLVFMALDQYKESCENAYNEHSTKPLEQYLLEVENRLTKLIWDEGEALVQANVNHSGWDSLVNSFVCRKCPP
jgi:hypothetical protein